MNEEENLFTDYVNTLELVQQILQPLVEPFDCLGDFVAGTKLKVADGCSLHLGNVAGFGLGAVAIRGGGDPVRTAGQETPVIAIECCKWNIEGSVTKAAGQG